MNLAHAARALDEGAPDAPALMTADEYANLAVLVASVRDDAANLLEWAASIEENANRLYRELTFGE